MIKEAYAEYAATLDTVFEHDRTQTVGSSEIGLCARKIFWVKYAGTLRGVAEDEGFEHDWGARIRGTLMEKHFFVPAMRAKYGYQLLFAGDQQRTLQLGHLSSTPDGVLIDQKYDVLKHLGVRNIKADCILTESKTIDPRTNIVEAKEAHYFQTIVQLGLTRELTPYKPEYALVSYTDASFWSEVLEFPIQFDAPIYAAAKKRATTILTAKHGRNLPPEGYIAGGKECSFCQFTTVCGIERRGVPYGQREATPQFAAEMTDAVREANKIKLRNLKGEAELKKAEIEIKNRLRAKGVRRIEDVVTWYELPAHLRFSGKAMKERLIELGEDIEVFGHMGEPSDRLTLAATPLASKVRKRRPVKRKAKRKAARKRKTKGRRK